MQKTASGRGLKVLTISLLLLVCGYSLSYNILSNTMDPLITHFSLTGASQGLMNSMLNLGSMLTLVFLPLLQGRVHKLWLILISCAIQVLMLLLTGASGNFGMLLAACMVLGAGNNSSDSLVNSYMVDLHPGDSAKYLGLLHGFFGIGGLLTPILISWILNTSGWRVSYYVAAAVFALLILLFCILGMPKRKDAGAVQTAKESTFTLAMLKDYLRSPRNLLLLAAAVFCAANQSGLVGWVVRYTSVTFNDAQVGSYCLTVYWVCTTVCRIFTPRLNIRPGRMLVFGAIGAGLFHAAGVISGSPIGMLAASGLIGITSGHCIPVLLGEAAVGNEDRTSLTTSGMFLVMGMARMIMPLIMGAVGVSSLFVAMLLPAVAGLLCALCSFLACRKAA